MREKEEQKIGIKIKENLKQSLVFPIPHLLVSKKTNKQTNILMKNEKGGAARLP